MTGLWSVYMSQKGEQTREKIMQSAQDVFKRQGFRATSINDLVAAAGITKGNLYFHFTDKNAIALAVLQREQQLFYQFLEKSLCGQTPLEGLDNFLNRVLVKHREQGFVGGCLFGNTALEAGDTLPYLAEVVREVFNHWQVSLEQQLVNAQNAGEVRNDVPAHQLATHIVATIEGGIMQARLAKDEAPLKNALESIRHMLTLS